MAAVTLLGSVLNTTSGTHTVTATPAVNDLIVLVIANSGYTGTVLPTDNQGGTYTLVTSSVKASSADTLQVYVRTALIPSAVSTVFTHAAGTTTGGGMSVYKITGMNLSGSNAVRQSAIQSNQATSTTPAPVFTKAALTGNPIITAVFNATSPAGTTIRSSPAYTRDVNLGYSTPTTGLATGHINSGETATTITWGGTSASAFCSIAVEFYAIGLPISTFNDSFSGTSIDTTKWTYDSVSTPVTVANNTATITPGASNSSAYGQLLAGASFVYDFFDVTGGAFIVEVRQAASGTGVYTTHKLFLDGNNSVLMHVLNGNLEAVKQVGGSATTLASVTYNATTHRWWRMREASGTTFWDYSADGQTWTNLTSATNPIAVTTLHPELAVIESSSTATPGSSIFANVNPISPITTLNTPADTATGQSTTPTLNFTGFDFQGDSVEYEVEVDTVNTFDSQVTAADSYSETNSSNFINVNSSGFAVEAVSQSFIGDGGVLTKATVYINKTGSPSGNVVCKIFAHSGTYGTNSLPTGSALAISDLVDSTTLATSLTLKDFTFSGANKITLTNGTHYVLEVEYTSIAGVQIGTDNTSPTHAGNLATGATPPATSVDATQDMCFYVYTSKPLLNKLSTTDAGFTAGHPFTSGVATDFTVQAGDTLTGSTTYYWRVRAIDPTGSNIYGAWSTTRSFTTASGSTTTPQTITGVANILKTVLQTITGKADILKNTLQTITGLSRITKVVPQTIVGLSRITATTLKTITGKADILKTTSQVITGLSRITITTLKTITGLSRITKLVPQTITGISRITAKAARTITGLARITVSTLKTITGVARVQISTSKTITGISRVTKNVLQTITGVARITVSTTKTITGKADIFKNTLQTITGLARVTVNTLKTIPGLARITALATKTITGIARITVSTSRTITGKARVTVNTLQTITGLAKLQAVANRTITGLARVTVVTARNVTGLSRIQKTVAQTLTGLSRITILTTRTVTGLSRITVATARTVTGLGRVTINTLQTIPGLARITIVTSRTITGVANIVASGLITTLQTITGKARVTVFTQRAITGKASILSTISKPQPQLIIVNGHLAMRIGGIIYRRIN